MTKLSTLLTLFFLFSSLFIFLHKKKSTLLKGFYKEELKRVWVWMGFWEEKKRNGYLFCLLFERWNEWIKWKQNYWDFVVTDWGCKNQKTNLIFSTLFLAFVSFSLQFNVEDTTFETQHLSVLCLIIKHINPTYNIYIAITKLYIYYSFHYYSNDLWTLSFLLNNGTFVLCQFLLLVILSIFTYFKLHFNDLIHIGIYIRKF